MAYRPRILFIDAYDSFSNNIISLLETSLGVEVSKVYIDSHIEDLHSFLDPFAAIVLGPGPGSPLNEKDVGLFKRIWALEEPHLIPTLGICLGFQSLAVSFGGSISQLPRPRHGLETDIISSATSVFMGLPKVRAVQYHSLHISLGHDVEDDTTRAGLWQPSTHAPHLLPLAWDFDARLDDSANPNAILMAIQHTLKPFTGVQFHPESICSEESARAVVRNWWSSTHQWHVNNNTHKVSQQPQYELVDHAHLESPLYDISGSSGTASPSRSPSAASTAPSTVSSSTSSLMYSTLDIGHLTVPLICETLGLHKDELVVLDSEMRQMRGLGESSIIGLIEADTVKVCYTTGNDFVTLCSSGTSKRVNLAAYNNDIFTYLKDYLRSRSIDAPQETAFCGGFVGYVTYEAGLETIDIQTPSNLGRPDICFAFVERSVVLDHVRHKVYIQTIKSGDEPGYDGWLTKVETALIAQSNEIAGYRAMPNPLKGSYYCQFPSERVYRNKIRDCQNYIRQGESYEICLTDQTMVSVANTDGRRKTPWERYVSQRRLNRAPFAAYIQLSPLALLSTSPERFLCWSRPTLQTTALDYAEEVTTCQFRPIKGTVKKTQTLPCGSSKDVSLAEATAVLQTPKERAENLMIVDLIRHDLHGVAGSGNISVPALMVVEEYETVYQLVSVIEGRLRTPSLSNPIPRTLIGLSSSHPANDWQDESREFLPPLNRRGIDVLAAALPPGSMTGAPKRRACRLLRDIEEQRPRSIYSGVVGYMCVTGKGDFSVVIRSAYKWDDEQSKGVSDPETWHIGAGGAITDLSTEVGEWDEMLAKLQGTLGSFAPGAEASLPR